MAGAGQLCVPIYLTRRSPSLEDLVQTMALTIPVADYKDDFHLKFIQDIFTRLMRCNNVTVKQKELLDKIINIYLPYLREKGLIDGVIPPFKSATVVKSLDTHTTEYNGDYIYLRFPFSKKWVEFLKSLIKTSETWVSWDATQMAWKLAATEENVVIAVTILKDVGVNVPSQLMDIYNKITEVESVPYKIELDMSENGEVVMSNCPESMDEYITEHIGWDDVVKLASYAGVLGFSLSPDLREALTMEYGSAFVAICESDKNSSINSLCGNQNEALTAMVTWAATTGNYPLVVFNPYFLRCNNPCPELVSNEEFMSSLPSDGMIPNHIKLVMTAKISHLKQYVPVVYVCIGGISKALTSLINKMSKRVVRFAA